MPAKDSGKGCNGHNRRCTNESAKAIPLALQGPVQDVDLERWAQLIADGEVSFPGDLAPEQAQRLQRIVRERMRRRLIRFIARRIAKEIAGGAG